MGRSFFQGSCLLNYHVIKMLMAVYRTFSSQPNCFVNNKERPLCCGEEHREQNLSLNHRFYLLFSLTPKRNLLMLINFSLCE